MKMASLLSMATLGVIALAHLLRMLFHIEVVLGGFRVPVWMSLVAFLYLGVLTLLFSLEIRKGDSR